MPSRKVGLVALGLAVLALVASGAIVTWSGTSPRAAAAERKDDKIKALLKERHATLEKIAAETSEGYRIGRASLSQVAEAKRAARNAELELCDTDKERVAVLEKMLEEAKDYEKSAEGGFQAARITHAAALKATADRLEVEIALERAKAK